MTIGVVDNAGGRGNPYRDLRNGKFASAPIGADVVQDIADSAKSLDKARERVADRIAKDDPAARVASRGKGTGNMFGVKDTGETYVPKRTPEMSDFDWEKDQKRAGEPIYDFSERAEVLDGLLEGWRKSGVDTETIYRSGGHGEWSKSRLAAQKALEDKIWNERAANVPNEGRGIIAGGLGGSGKGYTLKNKLNVDKDSYFTINPDDVKEAMADANMIPILDKRFTPMEMSPIVHEEASIIAKRLAERAYVERKNIVWDFTMGSVGSTEGKLKSMRDAGYDNIGAVFVDVSMDKSLAQARSRWENGLRAFGDVGGDKELGGRFLPSGASELNKPADGSPWRSKNRAVFEEVKDQFDAVRVYDNEKGSKVIEERGELSGS